MVRSPTPAKEGEVETKRKEGLNPPVSERSEVEVG